MSLEEKTKSFILSDVNYFYYAAIEKGVQVSPVDHVGCNLYNLNIGNATLTYLGTVDGTAKLVGVDGDIF